MSIIVDTQVAMSLAAILCGVSLLYLVMSRTLKRRIDERMQKLLDDGKEIPAE